jgi:hypothetical protein
MLAVATESKVRHAGAEDVAGANVRDIRNLFVDGVDTRAAGIRRFIPASSIPLAASRARHSCLEGQVGGWVAGPSLDGGQVAILRLYVGFSIHVTIAAYFPSKAQRIP